MRHVRRWLVVFVAALVVCGATALAQTPPRRPPTRRTPAARVAARPVPPRPVVVRPPVFVPYRPPWIIQHLGIILGVGIPLLIFGAGIVGALVRKARTVPRLHRARTRFAEFRQTMQRESKMARDAMDARQQRALMNFSAQEYAAAASDLVSISTHHREVLEKVEAEARQISRSLDAVEATEGEREADAIADAAERESEQLEEYGERLAGILRERLDALTAIQQAQAAAGHAPTAGRPPQMTMFTAAAMADARVHCRSCGAPLDPTSGAAACAYCGCPIVRT